MKCHAQVAIICLKFISSQDSAAYKTTILNNAFLKYAHRFWGEHCAQLSKEDRQSLGVSKDLLGWIIEGSGSTTFQDWLREAKFLGFSPIDFSLDSGNAVFLACDWNLVEILEELFLVDPTYNINLGSDTHEHTPLLLASYRGHKAIVKLLLEQGADVNATNRFGMTPLHWASMEGKVDIVELLLEQGPNINATTKVEETSLHFASSQGPFDIVKLLFGQGANVNVINRYDKTPRFQASSRELIDSIKLLLKKWVNKSTPPLLGTPLFWAALA